MVAIPGVGACMTHLHLSTRTYVYLSCPVLHTPVLVYSRAFTHISPALSVCLCSYSEPYWLLINGNCVYTMY